MCIDKYIITTYEIFAHIPCDIHVFIFHASYPMDIGFPYSDYYEDKYEFSLRTFYNMCLIVLYLLASNSNVT